VLTISLAGFEKKEVDILNVVPYLILEFDSRSQLSRFTIPISHEPSVLDDNTVYGEEGLSLKPDFVSVVT